MQFYLCSWLTILEKSVLLNQYLCFDHYCWCLSVKNFALNAEANISWSFVICWEVVTLCVMHFYCSCMRPNYCIYKKHIKMSSIFRCRQSSANFIYTFTKRCKFVSWFSGGVYSTNQIICLPQWEGDWRRRKDNATPQCAVSVHITVSLSSPLDWT